MAGDHWTVAWLSPAFPPGMSLTWPAPPPPSAYAWRAFITTSMRMTSSSRPSHDRGRHQWRSPNVSAPCPAENTKCDRSFSMGCSVWQTGLTLCVGFLGDSLHFFVWTPLEAAIYIYIYIPMEGCSPTVTTIRATTGPPKSPLIDLQ